MSDIPLLARSILRKLHQHPSYTLSKDAEQRLMQYPFNGNVRELRNILERAVLLTNTSEIGAQLIESSMASDIERRKAPMDLHSIERDHLQRLLAQYEGDKSKVAKELGISLRTLYRKLKAD